MTAHPGPHDKRRIALVGPSFFSYIEAIRSKLCERGHEAEFFDERHSNSIAAKLMYRLGVHARFPAFKNRHLDGIAKRIARGDFTDALLIDAEVCDLRFVERLRGSGVRVHVYMWDSAANKPRYLSYLDRLDGRASFDPEDCATHGLQYIPLFAEDVFAEASRQSSNAEPSADISFCGTLHSNRARRVGELESFAGRNGLQTRFFLFFHSRWLLALKALADINNARYLSSVSTRGFSKAEVAHLFASSRYVFDLPHPGQKGLTARTFEVLRAGSMLVTFNPFAAALPLGLETRVAIIERVSDLASVRIRGRDKPLPLSAEADYFLSIDRFIDQILEMMSVRTLANPGPGVEAPARCAS